MDIRFLEIRNRLGRGMCTGNSTEHALRGSGNHKATEPKTRSRRRRIDLRRGRTAVPPCGSLCNLSPRHTNFATRNSRDPLAIGRLTKNRGEGSLIEVRDVWTAAQLLITHYGPHAAARATERADELREAGDVVGIAVWQRILRAVEDLERGRRQGESLN